MGFFISHVFIIMKIIITESQSLRLKRRIGIIDSLVKKVLNQVDPREYNKNEYIEEIAWSVWDYFPDDTDTSILDELLSYVKTFYKDKIINHYEAYNIV